MDAMEMLGKIQEYLGEQMTICKKESEKVSEMTDDEKLIYLGKAKALMGFQMFVVNMMTEMI